MSSESEFTFPISDELAAELDLREAEADAYPYSECSWEERKEELEIKTR